MFSPCPLLFLFPRNKPFPSSLSVITSPDPVYTPISQGSLYTHKPCLVTCLSMMSL